MARFHKLCKLLYFFYTFLFISSISSLDYDVNGVPDTSQDFDEDLAIFSTKIDQLNVSVVIARGRHFESPFTSARRRRFHQARVIYYSNSCATLNVEYLLLCGDVQANPGPCRNSTGRPYSDNHRTSKNILRCMSLNARSICNKLNEFHDLVKMKNVDVVVVTETWLHQRILDTEILDSNYILFRRDRPQLQRGGGVMICVKSDFISVRRRDLENETVEAVVCELSGINNSKLIIAAFYRPPNMDSDYLHDLVNVLHNIHQTGVNNIFILGDFNFPYVVRLLILTLYLLKVYLIASGLNLLFLQLELRLTTQQYLIYLSLLFLNLLDILQFSQGNFPRTICLLLLTSLFH